MEAMTIMGMAASQARFLGLTARKSNVEYQGQQINQQRTALSNESANLYNEMMDLVVPTPPSTSDFLKTTYVLENSNSSYAAEDYTIANISKTYNNENEYNVTLSRKREYAGSQNATYELGAVTHTDVKNKENVVTHQTHKIPLIDTGMSGATTTIYYDESATDAYTGDNGSLKINKNQIYLAQDGKGLSGYDLCCKDSDEKYYFYQDSAGKNHFLTKSQLDEMISPTPKKTYEILYPYTYTKDETTEVVATLEKSETGRFSSIVIADDQNYSNDLKGRPFNLSAVQEKDEIAYENAYNDYEYNKTVYDKRIADINAKTEIIQQEDQQLELRLQQLDTEQRAISTEMDSVSKVIDDNVDKTFKVFA